MKKITFSNLMYFGSYIIKMYMIYVTNSREQLLQIVDANDDIIIDNQKDFNNLAFMYDKIIEYRFNNDQQIKIPKNVFHLNKAINYNEYQVFEYTMLSKILNGKKISNIFLEDVKKQLDKINFVPENNKLVIIQVGDLFASNIYIRNKINLANKLNLCAELFKLDETILQDELINIIKQLNNDDNVCSILVQTPLPKHIDQNTISSLINPNKDVDCFNPINLANMFINKDYDFILPCTPAACLKILDYYNINIESKNVVIIGRSNIVGKPLSILCLHKNATVTTCHSKTKNLQSITSQADILISAIGSANLVNDKFVGNDATCIDVGISYTENGIAGDIDFFSVYDKVKYITPVPNGVGPMTLAILFENYLKLLKLKLCVKK